MRHKLFGIVALFVFACSGRVETPHATAVSGTDAGPAVAEAQDAAVDAVEAVQEALVDPKADAADPKVEEGADVPEKETSLLVPAPLKVAERFVAAGGQKLCLAMVYQLNPEWRMDACDHQRYDDDAAKAAQQQAACVAQRDPLRQFAETVCTTVIAESLRLDLDPAMVLSVIKRESAFGRISWDHADQNYVVSTDVCKLTLPKSRIIERRPSRRAGVELLTWTFATGGQIARNRQPAIVEAETDESVTLDTCAAGEGGLLQSTPRELQTAGTSIGLTGTTAQRRATVDADPVLQIRVGCQAIADHRALFPPEQQSPWWLFLGAYNTGSIDHTDQWCSYTRRVMRAYQQACEGWVPGSEGSLSGESVKTAWVGCTDVQSVYEKGWEACTNDL